ncbi:hypothetical protein RB653_008791 [Dictyostelium firmibasis]|uniref:Uncharacterized protein n=1 Tax=Dictyostelium firmibasis TaxID=79012 RepID=A0AAN7YWV4_9MYCE
MSSSNNSSGFVKNENRRPPPTMCDSVRAASLKCSETNSKYDCKIFFEAATKCRSEKTKLDDEEKTIKKYLNDELTEPQRISLQNRIDEIKSIKSKQYPVPN